MYYYRSERNKTIWLGVLGLIIGVIVVFFSEMKLSPSSPEEFLAAGFMAFLFAGAPFGWVFIGRVLNLTIVGSLPVIFIVFFLRVILSVVVGWIAYPIALVYYCVKAKKEKLEDN